MEIRFDFDDDALVLFGEALELMVKIEREQPWNEDLKEAIRKLRDGIDRAKVKM